jgi:putative membrane protein (TIGR04086 family)
MGRSIGSVLLGLLYVAAGLGLARMALWFWLEETASPSRLALDVLITFVVTLLAGFVTAHVAGRSELAHGLALGAALVAVLGFTTLVLEPEPAPPWYQLALPAVTLPAALLGAGARALVKRPPPPAPPKSP